MNIEIIKCEGCEKILSKKQAIQNIDSKWFCIDDCFVKYMRRYII
jgi:hypothetical protein